ncbi:hypothetical protein STVA_41350 [Allostella vacuolata]|nr:hypothetical protein STVA_41350 [Stella vacuolata]
MANCLLAPINWVWMDGVAFSGGDWAPTLPLAGLATADPYEVARATSADAEDTVLTVDLGAQRLLDVVALLYANLSPAARIRVTTDEGYDSGWRDAYPVTHAPVGGYLPFGRPSADGRMPEDERDPRGVGWLLQLDAAVTATTVTLEVDDEGNPAGYVQAGVLFVAKAERPRINIANGFSLLPVEEATVRRSRAGTLLGRRQWQRKRLAGAFRWQHRDVALAQWYEAARMAGRTRPILFSAVTDMGHHADRMTLLGYLDEPTPVEHARFRYYGWPFAVTEV